VITSSKTRAALAVLSVAMLAAACSPPAAPPTASEAPSTGAVSQPATVAPSAAPATSSPSASPGALDWSYAGATGPEHWADLSDNYYACADGVTQSPIEIASADEKRERDPIFEYQAGTARIVNDGHTIIAIPDGMNTIDVYHFSQFDVDEPEPTLVVDSPVSYLTQLQFHLPPEHVIAGAEPAAAEVQFVHQHPNGAFTIVGAMVVEGDKDDAGWAPYIDAMGTPVGIEGVPATIDWPQLLPTALEAWHYDGSLTTPPCTERVRWIFLMEPIRLSAAQIDKMRAAYDGNNRPLQPFGTYRALTADLKDD